MNENNLNKDQKIFSVLRDDISRGGYLNQMKKEWRDLREYMLSDDEKKKLESMGKVKGTLYFAWRLFKAMILKLTPIRRLLLLFGFLMIINFTINKHGFTFNINNISGILIILFVLLLELKDKLLAQEELEAGHAVQEALAPQESPDINGWKLWLYTKSANEVGGDLIDFFETEKEKYILALGDVSGKGLTAALHAAKLQATIRALVNEASSLESLLEKINCVFRKYSMANFFATLFVVRFSSQKNVLNYVNAGHIPIITIKENKISTGPKGGAALGVLSSPEYLCFEHEFEKNEIALIYSDGITDAKNVNNIFFGEERLKNFLSKIDIGNKPLNEVGNMLLSEVFSFIGEAKIHDDITFALIKKL